MKASPVKKPKRNPAPPSPPTTRMSLRSSTRSQRLSSSPPAKPQPPTVPPVAVNSQSNAQQDVESMDGDEYDSSAEFEYEEDLVLVDESRSSVGPSEVDDSAPLSPPASPPRPRPSRAIYAADVQLLIERFGSQHAGDVCGLRKGEDDSLSFKLLVPGSGSAGLPLVLMTPEGGYPNTQHLACAEVDVTSDVEQVLQEVADLPSTADRSLGAVLEYLVNRLVRGEPPPAVQVHEPSDEEYDDDDELFGPNVQVGSSAFKTALRSDFKQILDAGYRPGYARISEIENVVVVSVRVSELGVPLRALEAWDSAALLRGSVVYLVLLANFGSGYPTNLDNMSLGQVTFKVGLSPKPKPSKAAIAAAFRKRSTAPYTHGEFESFALSASLDSLFNEKYPDIFATRRKFDISWVVSENFCLAPERPGSIDSKEATKLNEAELAFLANAPKDPMASRSQSTYNNYALIAFTFLIRRFTQNPRFCLVCYRPIGSEVAGGALRAFVCESSLCLYQCINLNMGQSLEHEICNNSAAVDLLVSLAYSAASEGGLRPEKQPVGLDLKVPATTSATTTGAATGTDQDLVDFDSLPDAHSKNRAIAHLISTLPSIGSMKAHLEGADIKEADKGLHRTRKLTDMPRAGTKDENPPPCPASAWQLLRWIVSSNTSYLKLVEEEDELVQGVNPSAYRQFRFIVGSPEKEFKLEQGVKDAQKRNPSAIKFPKLHAFHGSAVKNWHSILREGLWCKDVVNGRAYGNGVYFALQGEVSLGHYAAAASSTWKQAAFPVGSAAAIAEIVNDPARYVNKSTYLVVDNLDWIQCRYLLVRKGSDAYNHYGGHGGTDGSAPDADVSCIDQDPAYRLTLGNKAVGIPDVAPKLEKRAKFEAAADDELNPSDDEILNPPAQAGAKVKRKLTPKSSNADVAAPKEAFQPVGADILAMVKVLPPPKKPNRGASLAINRELKAMMDEEAEEGPVSCGHYFDFDRSHDNLFTWIVELPRASFDPSLPLVKDMVSHNVNSILMEIRFGESYPIEPPFFRVIYPRFLPFVQGGGGHVTAGGSICMDLLTPNGWSPANTISAVLLQIRVAMSNLEPRPARLDSSSWNQPYAMQEAIEGFKRAAATHGWQLPKDLTNIRA